jgi:putative transposase
MPRQPRQWLEGAAYHVFSRGSNRQAIFLNEGDFVEFELLFADALRAHHVECLGWSFMTTHWHAVIRSPTGGLSRFMQRVNQRYALRFDRRWGRTAHVFENRFGAVLQESEVQLLWTLRYLVRNPVEAGMCASPFDARWTSFAATAGLAPAPGYLHVNEILSLFGEERDTARARYVEFVLGTPDENGSNLVSSVERPEGRQAIPV